MGAHLRGGGMIRFQHVLATGFLLPMLFASFAAAQNNRDFERERDRGRDRYESSQKNDSRFAVRGGIGFTEGPDSFLMNLDIETMARDEVAVGLGLQLGVDDDFVILSPTLFTRYIFDFSGFENKTMKKLRPFLQGGAGLTYMEENRPGRDRDATDFLINIGAGVDFPLDDSISIGTRMLVNLIPGEVLDQRVYFNWEILSVRYSW